MPRTLPWAAGLAAAAVLAVLVAANWDRGPGDASGVGASPGPSVELATSPPTTSSPSPDPTNVAQPSDGVRALEGVQGKLDPGTYSISSITPLEIRFTVPPGWELPPSESEFLGPTGQDGREIGGVSFWAPTRFYGDPCRSSGNYQMLPADSSVEDVVSGLAEMWQEELSPPVSVEVSGFNGKQVTVTAPCAEIRYFALDVQGQTLLVIAHVWPETSPDGAAELQDIVDSIEIETGG